MEEYENDISNLAEISLALVLMGIIISIGIFALSSLKPFVITTYKIDVVNEPFTVSDAHTYQLLNVGDGIDSVAVYDLGKTTLYVEGVDYTMNYTSGVVTFI